MAICTGIENLPIVGDEIISMEFDYFWGDKLVTTKFKSGKSLCTHCWYKFHKLDDFVNDEFLDEVTKYISNDELLKLSKKHNNDAFYFLYDIGEINKELKSLTNEILNFKHYDYSKLYSYLEDKDPNKYILSYKKEDKELVYKYTPKKYHLFLKSI